jgi:hypothetical protein
VLWLSSFETTASRLLSMRPQNSDGEKRARVSEIWQAMRSNPDPIASERRQLNRLIAMMS